MTDSERLARWTFIHAIAMLVAGLVSLAADHALPVSLAAAVSFAGLIFVVRGRWTPDGRFGAANGITAARLALSLAAAASGDLATPNAGFALLWLTVFALDGLDGYIARRRGLASLFGEYFDKESDALLVLLLGFSLYLQDLLGAWVLLLGALRYLFVLAMQLAPAEGPQNEYRSQWARYSYTACILCLIATYLLPPATGTAIAIAGGAALVFSFLHYFHWLVMRRSKPSPQRSIWPRFLAAFLALNSLLLLPAHLGDSAGSDFLPLPDTDAPIPTLTWSRGWYDVALYAFVRRPNQDIFRLSADLAAMMLVLAWCATSRRREAWRGLLVISFVALLLYEAYEALALSFFHRPGLLYEDTRYLVNIYYLLTDSFNPRYASGLFAAIVVVGTVLWSIPVLFGVLARSMEAPGLRQALRLSTAPFLGLVAGAWFWYGPVSDNATVRSSAPRVANNLTASLDAALRQKASETAPVDSTYYRFSHRPVRRTPPIYLILIESYGRVLDDDPALRGGYRTLMDRMQRQMEAGGWHTATTTSVAPVTGGLSWLSMNTVLAGLSIDNRSTYLRLKDRAHAYPHLVRYLAENGWRTFAVQPPTRARPGLPAENPLGFDHTVYFDDLAYTGRPYSLWIIPDQYSLQYTHERYLQKQGAPYFVFFETASTHAPWDDTPPLVDDWRSLQRPNAVRPAAPPLSLAGKLTASIKNHLQQPRGDATERYLDSIVYDFGVIARYLLEDAPDSSLVLILGDHQPPMLRSHNFETPAHVIVKDPAMLERFQTYGFRPGMRIEPGTAIAHAGVYSLLVDVLTARDGAPLPGPDYRPRGVPPSILWKTR